MRKIRVGNDFTHILEIKRNGALEDLSSVLNAKLTVRCFKKSWEMPFEILEIGKIEINFKCEDLQQTGIYNLMFEYALPDESFSDGDRKCVIDEDVFKIVSFTDEADNF